MLLFLVVFDKVVISKNIFQPNPKIREEKRVTNQLTEAVFCLSRKWDGGQFHSRRKESTAGEQTSFEY